MIELIYIVEKYNTLITINCDNGCLITLAPYAEIKWYSTASGSGADVGGGGSETSKVSLPRILNLVECLVEGCMARGENPGRLSEHFMYQHWKSKVAIVQEGL